MLSLKREGVKHVPWLSLTEWHRVYKQVYSNDVVQQTKAYETLLAWKGRMPKLPVGVDCTLSIIQVCLRDHEWTTKISNGELPSYYENDLCLMYSTTVMRFLNHITNVGQPKQSSLFQIAKQLKIPEWIVNLRHDAAHGHELPSIGLLRSAINILLTWLHEEYWTAEANVINKYYGKEIMEVEEVDQVQPFTDLLELWTSVSLYIRAGYSLVTSIPDAQLQETLLELQTYTLNVLTTDHHDRDGKLITSKGENLRRTQAMLLNEISNYLTQDRLTAMQENAVVDALIDNVVFLPTVNTFAVFYNENDKLQVPEHHLPASVIKFWQSILLLLHNCHLVELLVWKLLNIVQEDCEIKERRVISSMWITSIVFGFIKLNIAQTIFQTLQHKYKDYQEKVVMTVINSKVQDTINKAHPHLKNVLCFNIFNSIPHFVTDIKFISKVVLEINEFSLKIVTPLLNLVVPATDEHKKECLQKLIEMYTLGVDEHVTDGDNTTGKLFTVAHLHDKCQKDKEENCSKKESEKELRMELVDQITRNVNWKLAVGDYHWIDCPIGALPWQIDTIEMLEPMASMLSNNNCENIFCTEPKIIPGIIDNKNFKRQSQIDWDNVLRKRKKMKRKKGKNGSDIIMSRAIQMMEKKNKVYK